MYVSYAGSRKDIDLEIIWFFAYWAWKYDSWVYGELFLVLRLHIYALVLE